MLQYTPSLAYKRSVCFYINDWMFTSYPINNATLRFPCLVRAPSVGASSPVEDLSAVMMALLMTKCRRNKVV